MEISNVTYLSNPLDIDSHSKRNRDQVKSLQNSSIELGTSTNSSKWVFAINHFVTFVNAPSPFDLFGKQIIYFLLGESVITKASLVYIL